jgi:hypothetical protein
MIPSITEALERLKNHTDYRILKRLDPEAVGGPALGSGVIRRAAIVDTETTGMDPKADQVIEIGIVVFEYAAESGQVGPVLEFLAYRAGFFYEAHRGEIDCRALLEVLGASVPTQVAMRLLGAAPQARVWHRHREL